MIPEILKSKKNGDSVRTWSEGCSTGEEAYSITILLVEHLEQAELDLDIKLFATDIDKEHVEIAGNGTNPESIISVVSPERLFKYFEKKNAETMSLNTVEKVLPDNILTELLDHVMPPSVIVTKTWV